VKATEAIPRSARAPGDLALAAPAAPRRRLVVVLVGLVVVLVAVAAAALFLGSAEIAPGAILRVLGGRAEPDSVERVVTLGLRLPRIVAAALAGGALAVAGAAFQGLTRNPLAEPAVLGVSAGAAFGVVTAQIFGLGVTLVDALGLTACAFAGALVAAGAVYLIASAAAGLSVQTLLLAGVIVGVFFSSAITVLISIVDINRLGGVIHWLLGNLAPIPPAPLLLFAGLTAFGFWLVVGHARELNLLALGEEAARQLGVNAERLKRRIFVGAALLTATVVAFAGPIGFVGLVVPHVLRALLGQDNRLVVPTSLVGGAIFLLVADTVARNVVAPAEVSVGVITSFCGAPFFIYILRTRVRPAS
jgi:iron complex transport system permease protein